MSDNPATELRLVVTEDKDGNIQADYQMLIKGTETTIHPRISHVLGQLEAAKVIIARKEYISVTESNSSSKGKKSGKGNHT